MRPSLMNISHPNILYNRRLISTQSSLNTSHPNICRHRNILGLHEKKIDRQNNLYNKETGLVFVMKMCLGDSLDLHEGFGNWRHWAKKQTLPGNVDKQHYQAEKMYCVHNQCTWHLLFALLRRNKCHLDNLYTGQLNSNPAHCCIFLCRN